MRSIFQISVIGICYIFRLGVGKRFGWRKFIVLGAITTAVGILLPTFVFPNAFDIWIQSPLVTVSPYNPLVHSSLSLSETHNEAKLEQTQHFLASPVVSVNSSEPERVRKERTRAARRRDLEARRRRRRAARARIDSRTLSPPPPGPHRFAPTPFLRRLWSLPPDEALLYAKKEIENASAVIDDPELYAPLFKNVSAFRKSYELMEMLLKVYIYPDGSRPIFHQPHLMGIYASEGWFMKLMEENRQFVTRDPKKAHLFYLPYSARQLQMTLYVPGSHNMRPLSIFLRDYVNNLASKYPFWNRTRGSDHFLVACHDWGSYTLTEHEDLTMNTIKALCNADLSEGIFKAENDVSLPETAIRNPGKPLRYVGGLRVSQRPILAFFAGNMHGRVRPTLLKYWQDKDPDMRIYGPLPTRVSRKMSYVHHMKSSKYCLCPMGHEVNSPRIVEAIYYECVPVIIADNFVPPLSEVFDWRAFSVIVAENDIPRLKEILEGFPMRRYLEMQTNVKMVQKHFLWNPRPYRYDLFHMILHSVWLKRLSRIQMPSSDCRESSHKLLCRNE